MIGRGPLESASRRLGLLPRSLPVGLYRPRQLVLPDVRRPVLARRRLADSQVRQLRVARRRIRRELLSPALSRQLGVCQRRDRRRQVLWARGVAGKSWSGGGPRMRGARHNLDSSFTCRR